MNTTALPSLGPFFGALKNLKSPSAHHLEVNASRHALAQSKLARRVNRDIFDFWLKRYLNAVRRGYNSMSNTGSFRGHGEGYEQELRKQLGDAFKVASKLGDPSWIIVTWD